MTAFVEGRSLVENDGRGQSLFFSGRGFSRGLYAGCGAARLNPAYV